MIRDTKNKFTLVSPCNGYKRSNMEIMQMIFSDINPIPIPSQTNNLKGVNVIFVEKYNLTKINVIKVDDREINQLKLFSAFQKLMISKGRINKKYVVIKRVVIKKIEDNNCFIVFL